jgi:hypothetical protein
MIGSLSSHLEDDCVSLVAHILRKLDKRVWLCGRARLRLSVMMGRIYVTQVYPMKYKIGAIPFAGDVGRITVVKGGNNLKAAM